MRRWIHSPPTASPRMNALSISSKACVEDPSTSASMRIHATSYMNDDAPVTNAAPRKKKNVPSRRSSCGTKASVGVSCPRKNHHTAPATAKLISAAVRIVPGSPTAAISTNPLTSTPAAAPRLFVKYSIASDCPGRCAKTRSTPAVMSGNVIPSSTD